MIVRSAAVTIALFAPFSPLAAQRPGCEDARDPKRLPAVSALIDSADAIAGLATIDAPDGMLFSLVFRERDSLPFVRPLFGTDSAAGVILASRLRAQQPSESWGIRVRLAQGPTPSLRIERATFCPPAPIATEAPAQVGIATLQTQSNARVVTRPRRSVTVSYRALVSEEGEPLVVHIVQSSGVREIDEHFLQGWREGRFRPAVLDGVPIRAWYRSDRQPTKPAAATAPKMPESSSDSVFMESEVDEKPVVLSGPPLHYPDHLREAWVQGRVTVRVIIDKRGRVEPQSIEVIDTPNSGFNEVAKRYARGARFRPAGIQGQAVRVQIDLPIDFKIKR